MSAGPIAETTYGKLRGTLENGIRAYRGVPFAKPPIGALRFRPPQRAESWEGVREAARFGAGSYQANRPLAPVLGIVVPEQSEDCLTLNVWTPADRDGGRRPVMVWFHGGAWVIGAGSEAAYDGAALARRGDAVIVTANYRLGPFGFLRGKELGLDSTGNEALLDQIAALEWVRDEIAAFGGDPANVTVFGNSAGAVNIACMLTMPRARGLFHKAILQSGALNLLRAPQAALATTHQMLQQLGIEPERASALRDVPASALVSAMNALAGRSVLPPFSPIADGELIPERPYEALAGGSARNVPLIVGTNLEEMKLYRFLDPAIDALDPKGLVDRCSMVFAGSDSQGRPHGARIAETYRAARAERGEDPSPAEIWLAISTDYFFRAAALRLAEIQASHTPAVFVYELAWKATTPDKPQGAVHGLELPFVFGTFDTTEVGAIAGRTPAARALSESVQGAWTSFARTGRPSFAGMPEWPAYGPPRRATLELSARPRVLEAPRETERGAVDAFVS
jgi:para-nitrobenzyl esterase